MSNDELQQLKALAQAATPGPWEYEEALTPFTIPDGVVVGGDGTGLAAVFTGYDWQMDTGDKDEVGAAIYESIGEPRTIVEGAGKADAAFMCAANPKAILALIAKVEATPSSANGAEGLPELPEPSQAFYRQPKYYTADQLQAYARAAVLAERSACAEACMRASPNRAKVKAIGESAHYVACADAIRARK